MHSAIFNILIIRIRCNLKKISEALRNVEKELSKNKNKNRYQCFIHLKYRVLNMFQKLIDGAKFQKTPKNENRSKAMISGVKI